MRAARPKLSTAALRKSAWVLWKTSLFMLVLSYLLLRLSFSLFWRSDLVKTRLCDELEISFGVKKCSIKSEQINSRGWFGTEARFRNVIFKSEEKSYLLKEIQIRPSYQFKNNLFKVWFSLSKNSQAQITGIYRVNLRERLFFDPKLKFEGSLPGSWQLEITNYPVADLLALVLNPFIQNRLLWIESLEGLVSGEAFYKANPPDYSRFHGTGNLWFRILGLRWIKTPGLKFQDVGIHLVNEQGKLVLEEPLLLSGLGETSALKIMGSIELRSFEDIKASLPNQGLPYEAKEYLYPYLDLNVTKDKDTGMPEVFWEGLACPQGRDSISLRGPLDALFCKGS